MSIEAMNHPLRCRCGTIRGNVTLPAVTMRAVCYCTDCQAYAHFLGPAAGVLDDDGGSELVATLPSQVRFEQGLPALACMSLFERGMLRWYAGCCNTPIGNTPRDHRIHYVGLLHNALSSQPLTPSFGPARIPLNTASAKHPVPATRLASVGAILKLMTAVVPARFSGRFRDNPFFRVDSGEPIRQPRVLSVDERSALGGAI